MFIEIDKYDQLFFINESIFHNFTKNILILMIKKEFLRFEEMLYAKEFVTYLW